MGLIVMHFFGYTIAEFFDRLPEEEAQVQAGFQRQRIEFVNAPSSGGEAFGTAPWPCRNPVSDCGGKLLIREHTERMARARGRINYGTLIGDFVCPQCGFTYSRYGSREDDSKNMVWVREYGYTWKAELRKVWADQRYNITQAASHLGVSVMVARTQASRCGLVVPKPGQRMPQCAKDCRLERRRRVPLESQRKFVEWAGRDADLSRRVADAASTLFQAPGKPVRVTQRRIFRLLEESNNLYCNRDKLPATLRAMSKVVESEEQFGHRRLRHSVTEYWTACVPLARWRLNGAVGYKRLRRFPSLRLEIDSLLARSGGTDSAQIDYWPSEKRLTECA